MLPSLCKKFAAYYGISAWTTIVITFCLQSVHCGPLEGAQNFGVNQSNNAVCPCVDVPPLGGLTCKEQKSLNKCGEWWMLWGDFCSITCGRCSCELEHVVQQSNTCQCNDVQPPGTGSCEKQKRWGKCDADWMMKPTKDAPNGYCAITCGRCDCENDIPQKQKLAETSLDESGESCTCSDIIPANSGYSCQQQKEMDKCEADWMFNTTFVEGYCQTTCGRCTCSTQQTYSEQARPCLPFKELLNRTEGLRLYASLFDNEVMDSFMESNLNQSVTILVPRDEGFQKFLDEYELDIQHLVNDPFLTLQSIVQPNILSMGAYYSADFLPKQLLLTQSGFSVQIDEIGEIGWQIIGDNHHRSIVVQPDIQLCEATVQIVSEPIIPVESLQALLPTFHQQQHHQNDTSFNFEAVQTYPEPAFIQELVKPKTCVPFIDFLDIIEGVGLYSELFKDQVVQSVIETSLQEPVTILVPMDEGFRAFLEERDLTVEQLREDSFNVVKQIITPSIIPSGAYKTDSFEQQQQFVIYSGFNLSVDLMQDGRGSWYFQGEKEDLALISQPDIELCNAIVHIITKPLLPNHTLQPTHNNTPSPQQDDQSISQMLNSLASLSLQHHQTPQNNSDQEIVQPQSNKNQSSSTQVPSEQLPESPSSSQESSDYIAPQMQPLRDTSIDDSQYNISIVSSPPHDSHSPSPSPSPTPSPSLSPSSPPLTQISVSPNTYKNSSVPPQSQEYDTNLQSPSTPRCLPFQNSLNDLDDVSLFAQLFEDEFLKSYMESTLQQRMTILVPSDDGFQKFLDENDLTLEFLMTDPFLVLVSIVQPNIIIMGAFETKNFIEQQSLLTQSGESLTADKEAQSSNWYLQREGQKALIIDSDIQACNAIIQVIDNPLIQPQMLEESAQISGSKFQLSNTNSTNNQNFNDDLQQLPKSKEQIVNVTMSIQLLDPSKKSPPK